MTPETRDDLTSYGFVAFSLALLGGAAWWGSTLSTNGAGLVVIAALAVIGLVGSLID